VTSKELENACDRGEGQNVRRTEVEKIAREFFNILMKKKGVTKKDKGGFLMNPGKEKKG